MRERSAENDAEGGVCLLARMPNEGADPLGQDSSNAWRAMEEERISLRAGQGRRHAGWGARAGDRREPARSTAGLRPTLDSM